MAKKSMIARDVKRERLYKQTKDRREKLLAVARDKEASPEDRFKAQMKLAKLPRNGAKNRQRNRCALTGRPRGFHGRFKLCRVMLRDLGNKGLIPGLTKSSW